MNQTINVALVGLGRAGHFHLNSITQIPKANLKYIVDPAVYKQAPRLPDRPEIAVLPELTAAIDDPEIDAVIIASPTPNHFVQITSALKAHKHVFAEKPLGQSMEEIRTSYRLARENQKALFLGFQRRYDHNFQLLKSKIPQAGALRLYRATSRDNPVPSIDYLKISGNIFHDMLIHDFDMLIHLLGPVKPDRVTAMGYAHDPEIASIPDYDHVVVTIQYDNGLICTIDTSRSARYGYDQRIEVFGDSGMITAQNQIDHTIEIRDQHGAHLAPINFSFPQRYRESYRKEVAAFVKGISEQSFHNISEEECMLSHLMAEASHQAAVTGKMIDFKEFYMQMIAD